ncbi:TPA: hypothetical protein QCH62_004682 [Enterobacter kobei]|nr:hypothetical protein [Enterobacter kobei]
MKQKFIEWFTKNNNGCSPAMEDDRSFVYEMTQHMFEAYQAGVAEGEARCAALAAELRLSQIDAACYKHGMEASNERLIQVAAENAALNKFIKADCWVWDDKSEEYFDAVDCMPETPATDDFLAEVRASAVEGAVGTIMVHMNHQHVAVAEALHILRTHAAKLRKEAAQ